jgi:hypothetical protein
MRQIASVSVVAAALLLTACSRPPSANHRAEALQIFDQFQTQLLVKLKSTIEADGTAAAISVCKTASPDMEKQMSAQGWTVRRVSDRPRNPDHAPDPFESRILAQWVKDMQAGKKLEPVSEVEAGEFRVMRPIVIEADLCMRCHGMPEQMDAAAAKEIAKQYPGDKATGYHMGDLRGAFSARRKAE